MGFKLYSVIHGVVFFQRQSKKLIALAQEETQCLLTSASFSARAFSLSLSAVDPPLTAAAAA